MYPELNPGPAFPYKAEDGPTLYPCAVYKGSERPKGAFIGADIGWLNAVLVRPEEYAVFLFPFAQHGLWNTNRSRLPSYLV